MDKRNLQWKTLAKFSLVVLSTLPALEDLDRALATTIPFKSSTQKQQSKVHHRGSVPLASTIAIRGSMRTRQLGEVTRLLESIESTGAATRVKLTNPLKDVAEEDELMEALDKRHTRFRNPRNMTNPPSGNAKMKPAIFDGRSSWEEYLTKIALRT